jgi:hypothetical protein
MSKVMFSFPEKLVMRMKAVIPARERSKVLASLLEREIKMREKHLFSCAKELEENKALRKEMGVWDAEFGGDGLEDV